MNTGNPLQQEEKGALSGKAALVGSITQLEWRSDMQAKRKLPIGIQTFREIREQNHYYVDKTAYIRRLVDEGKHYFLSRPRRFGKSLLIDTLKELFEGNEPLFRGLVIHECWDWSMRYPVVRLSFGGGNFKVPGYLHTNLMAQLDAVERRTQVVSEYATGSERFAHLLEALHDRTGQPVAVLVDEYDKPILDALDVPEVARDNRDFLRGVYAVIKDSDAHVKFTLLTGVSKFSKVSLFSGLNNLTDITLSPRYSALCGYTDADLDTVFAPELPGLDRDDIRRWYNGYSWLGEEKVYNPFGILLLFFNRKFGAYWFETGTPTFLIDTLVARAVGALSLDGMLGSDALLSTFDVDHIATEALLFQTGYLTIQGEEDRGGRTRYRLGYPNREVRQSLNESLLNRLADNPALVVEHDARLYDLLRINDFAGLEGAIQGVLRRYPLPMAHEKQHRRLRGLLRQRVLFLLRVAGAGHHGGGQQPSRSLGHGGGLQRSCVSVRVQGGRACLGGCWTGATACSGLCGQISRVGYPIHLIGVAFSKATRNVAAFEVARV